MQKARSHEGHIRMLLSVKPPGTAVIALKPKDFHCMSLYITTSDFSAVPLVLPALQADFMDLTELIHFQSSRHAGGTASDG